MDGLGMDLAKLGTTGLLLVEGRLLLALLPAGSPGGGSRDEWPAALGASATLVIVAAGLLSETRLLPPLIAALLLPALVGLRCWMGPAAMRSRDGLAASRPESGLGRVLLWALRASVAGVVIHRCQLHQLNFGMVGLLSYEHADRIVQRFDVEGLLLYLSLIGAVSLVGLVLRWGAVPRLLAILAAVVSVRLAAAPLGERLDVWLWISPSDSPITAGHVHPALIAEAPLVAWTAALAYVGAYRVRADRRCVVLAPLALGLPAVVHAWGYAPPFWFTALPFLPLALCVPPRAWKLAGAPSVLTLALAGLVSR